MVMSQGAAEYTLYTAGVCSANNSTSGLPLFSSRSSQCKSFKQDVIAGGCKQKANCKVQAWFLPSVCPLLLILPFRKHLPLTLICQWGVRSSRWT